MKKVMPLHVANVSLACAIWRLSDAQEGRVFRHLRESWALGELAPRPPRWGEAEWAVVSEIWAGVEAGQRRSATNRENAKKRWVKPVSQCESQCESHASRNAICIDIGKQQEEEERVYTPEKARKAKPASARRARRVPESFRPGPQHEEIAFQRGIDLRLELEKFRDHEFGVPRSDWAATFRNWLRQARPNLHPVDVQVRRAVLEPPLLESASVWEVLEARS